MGQLKQAKPQKRKKEKLKQQDKPAVYGVVLVALLAVLVALFFVSSKGKTREEKILDLFDKGAENVEVKYSEDMGYGMYAKRPIKQGEHIVMVRGDKTISVRDADEICPGLLDAVNDEGAWVSGFTASFDQMILSFLLFAEKRKGKNSKFYFYISLLPHNVSTVSWYWNEEEKECAPQEYLRNADAQMIQTYLTMFKKVAVKVSCLQRALVKENIITESDLKLAKWALLMVSTRTFGKHLGPIDLFNHNPWKAVSPFTLASENSRTHYLVASSDHEIGEQIFNSYGEVTPLKMLQQYGFIDESATIVASSPTLDKLLKEKEELGACHSLFFSSDKIATKNEKNLSIKPIVIKATMQKETSMLVVRPGLPDLTTLDCLGVLIQTRNNKEIAKFIANSLEKDIENYQNLLTKPKCLEFPLLRKVNEISLIILQNARETALNVANGTITMPDLDVIASNSDL
eukprot:m.345511 g.345511  ORF g.345511 m.345511 type:complete len:459 (-) comp26591_c0_seq1:83-1459(-)